MVMELVFDIPVDLKEEKRVIKPLVTQNDSVVFILSVTENGIPFDLTDATTVSLTHTRYDGTVVVTMGTRLDNKATFILNAGETSVAGEVTAKAQFYDADGRVSTLKFTYQVGADPTGEDYVPNERDSTLIEIVLNDGPLIIASAEEAAAYANEQGDYALQVGVDNETRYLNAVSSVALRDSTYPLPAHGDTVRVTGTSTTYRYVLGTGWVVTDVYNPTAIDNITSQVAEKVDTEDARLKAVKLELEDASPTLLAAIEGGAGTTFNLLSIPQDESVSPIKTTFMNAVVGKNKMNPANINSNLRYSNTGFELRLRGVNNVATSGLLAVEEGKTYALSGSAVTSTGGYFPANATLTDGQDAISNVTTTAISGGFSFTVPTGSGIKYVIFNLICNTTTGVISGTYQLEEGAVATSYEAYWIKNKLSDPYYETTYLGEVVESGGGISTDMLQEKAVTPEKLSIIEKVIGKNKVNPANIKPSLRYSPAGVNIADGTGTIYGSTGFIPVVEGEWYVYTGTAKLNTGGYFAGSATLAIGQAAISSITFVTPVDANGYAFQVPLGSGIKYALLNVVVDTTTRVVQGTLQVEEGEQGTSIQAYQELDLIKAEHIPSASSTPVTSSSLDNASWFNFLEGVSYGDVTSKTPKFREHWIKKDKDLVVAMTGTSLTARSSEHHSLHVDATSRPPLFHSTNFASHAWDKLKWEGQKYRRFDYAGFFTETGTFATQSNIADWDDGSYRYGLTRYADGASNVKFTVPINAWQFNFIYRSDKFGSEACTVAIAEGNGKMEVYNGTAWVEANGYVFSMKETEKFLSNIVVPDPHTANATTYSFASYKIGGNTTYQKRLKMRCKSAVINSRTTTKAVTISTVSGRLLYWGVEWSPRQFMMTFINASRGSHSMTVSSDLCLQHYQDNEIWSFKPDLIFTENPIHNSGGGGGNFASYVAGYWGSITNNFFFNPDSVLSLETRATANGVSNLEWVIFNSTITWNFNGIDADGKLVISEDSSGRMITALDAQMATHEWLKENKANVISINAVKYWVNSSNKIFGDLKTATLGSGKDGDTLTNEGSHWNDKGSTVMAKCILPVFDFII